MTVPTSLLDQLQRRFLQARGWGVLYIVSLADHNGPFGTVARNRGTITSTASRGLRHALAVSLARQLDGFLLVPTTATQIRHVVRVTILAHRHGGGRRIDVVLPTEKVWASSF